MTAAARACGPRPRRCPRPSGGWTTRPGAGREEDRVVDVVAARAVERARAGDEPQRRAAGRTVDPRGREVRLRIPREMAHGEPHDAAVGAHDGDPVAAAQLAEPVVDGGPGGRVDVADDDSRSRLARPRPAG